MFAERYSSSLIRLKKTKTVTTPKPNNEKQYLTKDFTMNNWSFSTGWIDLPDEARSKVPGPFDPCNFWLKTASNELTLEAMRQWFFARYEDPSSSTPHNGADGGYIFIYGGPFDPNDVIQERFGELVDYNLIEDLIKELQKMPGGHEWAPVERDKIEEYDTALAAAVLSRDDPARFLMDRLAEINNSMKEADGNPSRFFLAQLLHSAAITALEAYLLDTINFWVSDSDEVFRIFVERNTDIGKEKIPVSEIFSKIERIKGEVAEYLQEFVWHRLDKVKLMIERSFEITFPEINKIMTQVVIRHHIVHRGGRDKNGELVFIATEDVLKICEEVKKFSTHLESELDKRFKRPSRQGWFDFNSDFEDDLPF